MSYLIKHLYEFGEYRLDPHEKILRRGERVVEVTPKVFELLTLLVENHGRLLGKEELMDRLWADTFVEESNLTFHIRQLRKTLGDDAHQPRFVKTVRQHGYRFIAEVRKIAAEAEKAPIAAEAPRESTRTACEPRLFDAEPPASTKEIAGCCEPEPTSSRFFSRAGLVVLLTGALVAAWYARAGTAAPTAPLLAAPFAAEKLSTNGKVAHVALAPDGRHVFYTNGGAGEKQSLWVRQLDDGSSVQLIPPSDDAYYGLQLAPDGKQLYFTRRPRQNGERMGIYRVSVFGGVPQKIVADTEGWISLSPDGRLVSFVRCPYREDEYCSLYTASAADGSGERRLVSRPKPLRIGDNRFAPDGRSIAFASGQSANSATEFGLAEVSLEDGVERSISGEKFFNIKNLAWLPDRSGWLITASRQATKTYRVWQVSAATGAAEPLTKDSESYAALNLDRDATRLVATQTRQDYRLRLLGAGGSAASSRALADAATVSFAPDGKIYFSSLMSGNDEIWSIDQDGSNQRQLTNSRFDESVPLPAPDGKTVFFASNRSGAAHVWRMNADGSSQTQLTQREGGAPLFVSPDGQWVYFRHALSSRLWRVAAAGGNEELVLDRAKSRFAFAPDGTRVAFADRRGEERVLTVVALADGRTLGQYPFAEPKAHFRNLVWMPDGASLAYVAAPGECKDNVLWRQPLDGGAPQQIAVLGNEEMTDFGLAVAPDGKTFAVIQGSWLHDAVLLKGLK